MKIAFRVDASVQIGSGHVMRCITLAEELRNKGAEILFVCREHEGNLNSLLEEKGFQVIRLSVPVKKFSVRPEDNAHASWLGVCWEKDAADILLALRNSSPDWLIVDHYALDRQWEEKVRPHVGKIMVIDDLADRPHYCNLLLDQNPYNRMELRYENLIPWESKKLLGPGFALLRPEFRDVRKNLKQRDGLIRRILLFFGGSDPTNETLKALMAIRLLQRPEIAVDVVVGSANPNRYEIKALCKELQNTSFHCQISNMAELLNTADLAIGAGGATTLERCAVGIPSLVIAVAFNQEVLCKDLGERGIILYLGTSRSVSSGQIKEDILKIEKNKEFILNMQKKSSEFIDCLGAVKVANIITYMH